MNIVEEGSLLQASNSKGTLNYEYVVNLHIINTNKQFQNIPAQQGVGIPTMMSLYASIMSLDGLIRNTRQPKNYNTKMDNDLEKIRGEFRKLGEINTDDRKFIEIFFQMLDSYNYQLQQMNDLGLTPIEDVDDILPTIVEKVGQVIEVPPWNPSEGDLDYKKELGLPVPEGITYREEIERKEKERKKAMAPPKEPKPPKPEEEMTEFEKAIAQARVELKQEIEEREAKQYKEFIQEVKKDSEESNDP